MSAADNEALIQKFYQAFQGKDAETMASCYHEDIVFEDPGFGELKGEHAGNMWRMLLHRSADLELTFRDVKADDSTGSAHWEAKYTIFGRKVVNNIDAAFKFQDGKIIDHRDSFNFYVWAKQAFGFTGRLLGWTPFFQNKVKKTVNGQLVRFETKHLSK